MELPRTCLGQRDIGLNNLNLLDIRCPSVSSQLTESGQYEAESGKARDWACGVVHSQQGRPPVLQRTQQSIRAAPTGAVTAICRPRALLDDAQTIPDSRNIANYFLRSQHAGLRQSKLSAPHHRHADAVDECARAIAESRHLTAGCGHSDGSGASLVGR